MEVLWKTRFSNSYLQMGQTAITVAENSGPRTVSASNKCLANFVEKILKYFKSDSVVHMNA